MDTFVALSLVGMMVSLATYGCVKGSVQNPNDAKLFGKFNLSLLGIVGYLFILVASFNPNPIIRNVLIYVAGGFTLHLVHKAIKIKLMCPFCPAVWIVNVALVFFAVIS